MKGFRTAHGNDLSKRRPLDKCGGDFLMRRFTRSLYRAGLIGGAAFALSFQRTRDANKSQLKALRQAGSRFPDSRMRTRISIAKMPTGWTNFLTITRISTRT